MGIDRPGEPQLAARIVDQSERRTVRAEHSCSELGDRHGDRFGRVRCCQLLSQLASRSRLSISIRVDSAAIAE